MKIGIIGSGTWGTALAQVLTDNGNDVTIFGNRQEQIDDINNNHKNTFYFGSEITLDKKIKATTDLAEAISGAEMILLSVPTNAIRSVLEKVKPLLKSKVTFINTAKGFDLDNECRITEVIRDVIPSSLRNPIVSLVGPSHAEEVIVRDLTCVCSVCKNKDFAMEIAKIFSNDYFRVYANDDEVGSEIGVAMKNAIAIASGILEGLKYGDNARAALCTRGLAEIVRFGSFYGGKKETYLGLTGLGDLIVTCYSFHSRNFTAGLEIGKADGAEEFLKNNTKTVEGIRTIDIIYRKASENNIELPIIGSLYRIIYKGKKPSLEIEKLMGRPIRSE
mgnify:CR=1 FL=1